MKFVRCGRNAALASAHENAEKILPGNISAYNHNGV